MKSSAKPGRARRSVITLRSVTPHDAPVVGRFVDHATRCAAVNITAHITDHWPQWRGFRPVLASTDDGPSKPETIGAVPLACDAQWIDLSTQASTVRNDSLIGSGVLMGFRVSMRSGQSITIPTHRLGTSRSRTTRACRAESLRSLSRRGRWHTRSRRSSTTLRRRRPVRSGQTRSLSSSRGVWRAGATRAKSARARRRLRRKSR